MSADTANRKAETLVDTKWELHIVHQREIFVSSQIYKYYNLFGLQNFFNASVL